MGAWTIVLMGLGLAMDAFAVSIASGLGLRTPTLRHSLTIAGFFGAFQAGMPVIGWSAGVGLSYLVGEVDHWIAFGLLCAVGGHMIYNASKIESQALAATTLPSLLILSVATSIDALAAGISLPLIDLPLLWSITAIGSITFGLCFFGVYLGAKIGHLVEELVEIAGGVILIGIGVRILIEHML